MSQPTKKPTPLNLAAFAEILRVRLDLLEQLEECADNLTITYTDPVNQRYTFREMLDRAVELDYIDSDDAQDVVSRLRDTTGLLIEVVDTERPILTRLLGVAEKHLSRQISAPRTFWYPAPHETAGQVQA